MRLNRCAMNSISSLKGIMKSLQPVIVIAAFSVGFALAQVAAITRNQALEYAKTTPAVEVANAKIGSAEQQLNAARVPISGSASSSYNTNSSNTALNNGFSGSLSLNYSGLFGDSAETRSNAEIAYNRAVVGAQFAKIRSQAKSLKLWHALRRAQSGLAVAQQSLEVATLEDKQAQQRLAAGSINATERQTVVNRLQNVQFDLQRATNTLESARVQASLEWEKDVINASLEWSVLPTPNTGNLEKQLNQREDVFEARAAWISAGVSLEVARQKILPTVSVTGGVSGSAGNANLTVNNNLNSSFNLNLASTANAPTNWSLGVTVTLPINPSGITQLQPLERQLENSRKALEASTRAARSDINAKLQAYRTELQNYNLSLETQKSASKNLDTQLERQQLGTAGVLEIARANLEVARATDTVFAAQQNLDTATSDALESLASLMTP
jgi:outer membrane protein TolC